MSYCGIYSVYFKSYSFLNNKTKLKYLQSIYNNLVHFPLLARNINLSEDHIFNNEFLGQNILGFQLLIFFRHFVFQSFKLLPLFESAIRKNFNILKFGLIGERIHFFLNRTQNVYFVIKVSELYI